MSEQRSWKCKHPAAKHFSNFVFDSTKSCFSRETKSENYHSYKHVIFDNLFVRLFFVCVGFVRCSSSTNYITIRLMV